MHNDDKMNTSADQPATKGDLDRFATKDDLGRFATKDDLDRFATKDDLDRFATKDDLDRFAAKFDLDRFAEKLNLDRFATKADLDRFATKTDLSETRRALAIEIVKTNARIDSAKDELHGEMSNLKSYVTTELDRAVSKIETLWRESATLPKEIDRHAVILDDHAARIKALEDRPGPGTSSKSA
ncbi:MAG: hypothetical protein ACHQ49_13785 [Elusimicrobiota bacterium]